MSDSEKPPSFMDGLFAGFAEANKPKEVDLELDEIKELLTTYDLDAEQMVSLSMWLFGQSVKLAFGEGKPPDE